MGGGGGDIMQATPKTPLLGDIVRGEPRSVNYRHANSGLYTYVVVN